jgi:DNA-directed RNA polymerase specialized sigma24 family protein
MHRPQLSGVQVERTPAARALALKLVTEAEFLRLKVLARLHARGLPPHIDWCDLLQEAFARMLDGSRRRPDEVPLVAFLAGVIRSLKAEHWRRARTEAKQRPKLLAELESTVFPMRGGVRPSARS